MKVLISAYACEPHKGSEPGAGWNWSLAAARDNEVWVITRANNREAIEAELSRKPAPTLHVVYVDLPEWARWWKRGSRGVRLYYSLWQLAALREAKQLHGEVSFDLVHHLTFANAWLPALVGFVDAPFVLGPIDAGVTVPRAFYAELGPRGTLAELKVESLRVLSRANPFVRLGMRRATIVLAQNDESAAKLRRYVRSVAVYPHASVDPKAFDGILETEVPPRERTALVAGRLVAWKGTSLAIRAISRRPDWKLEIVGSGPDEQRLIRLAGRLGIADRVRFTPWLPQRELWRRMTASSVVIVPSIRDGAPLVAAEAASLGVPVIALDRGGPRALARMSPASIRLARAGSPAEAVDGIAATLASMKRSERKPSTAFSIDQIAERLCSVYDEALSRGSHATTKSTVAVG